LKPSSPAQDSIAAERARLVQKEIPPGGLFASHSWRIAPDPFGLDAALAKELQMLGRILLRFYQAVNLLYRQSATGRQPTWIATLLDQGKPESLLSLQRSPAFKNDVPRVIRPDIILTESGLSITELDSVPGGIGLTAWLNQTYSRLPGVDPAHAVLGGPKGMLGGFAGIFDHVSRVHIVISEEAATYRPEMNWLARQWQDGRFQVRNADFLDVQPGEAVYRFFELFDLANVPAAYRLFKLAQHSQIQITPPPKPIFEEKLLFALLWNRNLEAFWYRELGAAFFQRLLQATPYTWVVDPAPLPPQGAYPELNLTDWQQLKNLSQRQRDLVLKISGFSELAWGSRGVYLGSDLASEQWSQAVDLALRSFARSPFVLQRYQKPKSVEARYFNFHTGRLEGMTGRVRLCPYYFVHGHDSAARTHLGGVLATICPADKKIIHGMTDAILAPCFVSEASR
jgi:hypothetical protein